MEVTSNFASSGTLTTVNLQLFNLRVNNGWGINKNVWYDNLYTDDGANSSSQPDVGNYLCASKRTFSNGTANQFTTQIGSGPASPYGTGHAQQVNEQPLSTANGWSLSNTTRQTEEYTIESASVGDVDISAQTLIGYMGWIYAQVDSTANSPVHRIIVAGATTAKTMGTSYALFSASVVTSTYPAGNTDIGMDAQYTTTPHLTSLAECGMVMVYTPASTSIKTIEGLALASNKTIEGLALASNKTVQGLP